MAESTSTDRGAGCMIHGPACPPGCPTKIASIETFPGVKLGDLLTKASAKSEELNGGQVKFEYNDKVIVVQGDRVVGEVKGGEVDSKFQFKISDLDSKPANFSPSVEVPPLSSSMPDEERDDSDRLLRIALEEVERYSVNLPGELVISNFGGSRFAFLNGDWFCTSDIK